LSRRAQEFRVDLTTGEGLRRALSGCDTIIDASNNSSKSAAATLVDGSKRLLATAQEAGVNHHVCVSIVGCDLVPVHYFRVKCEQERTVEQGSVPWSIVRATQFHELVATRLNSLGSWGVLPLPRAKLQPVASVEAARAVAEVAEAAPLRRRINVAGPEVSG
jgi:uncharacterized protein YbjT (DUF2867 family)